MTIMALDGSSSGDAVLQYTRQSVINFFKKQKHDIKIFTLRDMRIARCCGYFQCWLKTPGICVINDEAREIVRCAVNSEYWIFFTPVTFGSYSYELKKAIDRMPPVMLPYFMKTKDEVHHKIRYEKRAHLVVFGSTERHDAEAEDIFNALVVRNSLNFQNLSVVTKIMSRDDNLAAVENKVKEAFLAIPTKYDYE